MTDNQRALTFKTCLAESEEARDTYREPQGDMLRPSVRGKFLFVGAEKLYLREHRRSADEHCSAHSEGMS